MIYQIITWFTGCPYFSFFSSICSIGSAVAIINFLYFRKPKPVTKTKESTEIVDILVEMASKTDEFWLPFEPDNSDKFPDLEGQKIDYPHSFIIMPDNSMDFLVFALVKTSKDLRLYGCLDALKSSYRLITTNADTPSLENLLSLASMVEDLSDEEFSEQILSKLKGI